MPVNEGWKSANGWVVKCKLLLTFEAPAGMIARLTAEIHVHVLPASLTK
jgi:hypothetical protein